MKRLIIVVFILLAGLGISGQSWEKFDPSTEFNRRLSETALQSQSIVCDFVQEKYLDVFAEKVISKGKFYFRKADKICLSYTEPVDYLIVINGQKLKIVSDGKTNIVDLGTNKMMHGMNNLLAACMTGDLGLLKEGYQMEYLQDKESYLVKIKPLSQGMKAYMVEMAIWFDKKDMAVKQLRLSENANDYTEYRFLNRKFNTLTDDEKFIIR